MAQFSCSSVYSLRKTQNFGNFHMAIGKQLQLLSMNQENRNVVYRFSSPAQILERILQAESARSDLLASPFPYTLAPYGCATCFAMMERRYNSGLCAGIRCSPSDSPKAPD